MKQLKILGLMLLMAPLLAFASGGETHLDVAPINSHDRISLQRGAHAFVNYCMGCHNAAYMRYSRLTDLGLTEQQIKDYFVPVGKKVGDVMSVSMNTADAKKWFGAAPPDLSVIARSRGVDWLYTYLRQFYKDDSRPMGWNNLLFDKVGMPHVVWELQGVQSLKTTQVMDAHGHKTEKHELELVAPGKMTAKEYDGFVADLVNYLAYMGEPAKNTRSQIGVIVLFVFFILFIFLLLLKNEYWKDVK